MYAFEVPPDIDAFKREIQALVVEFWHNAVPAGSVKEIRALNVINNGERKPIAGFYRTPEAFANAAIELTTHGATGCYFTAQTVSADAYLRSPSSLAIANRWVCANEAFILAYERLVIDIDPAIAVDDAPASDEERALAHETAFKVRDHLTSLGWPSPFIIDSGSGCQIHYRVSLTRDDRELVEAALRALGSRFNIANPDRPGEFAVKVDEAVSDPGRILRIPGTINRKGIARPGRMYRLARVIDGYPPGWLDSPVDRTLIEALAAAAPPAKPKPPKAMAGGKRKRSGSTYSGRPATEAQILGYLAKKPGAIGDRRLNGSGVTFCVAQDLAIGLCLPYDVAFKYLCIYNAKCEPPWELRDLERKLNEAYEKSRLPDGYILDRWASNKKSGSNDIECSIDTSWLKATGDTDSLSAAIPDLAGEQPAATQVTAAAATSHGTPSLIDAGPPPSPLAAAINETQQRAALPSIDPSSIPIRELPDDPHRLAREFLKKHHTQSGCRTLHLWASSWWSWNGSAYREISAESLTTDVNAFAKENCDSIYREKLAAGGANSTTPTPTKITNRLVKDVIGALGGMCRLKNQAAGEWIDHRPADLPAKYLLPCQTVLIDVMTGQVMPTTPRFFATTALDYDPGPDDASPTNFLDFLASVWPDDVDSQQLLLEYMGLLLIRDTSFQKLLAIIGLPRTGKGTIGRLIQSLLGAANVCSATMSSLSKEFGLKELVGKTVTVIGDAKFGSQRNPEFEEKLLMITGEDSLPVRGVFANYQSMKLDVRFVLFANRLPRFEDSSGALPARFLLLETRNSFLGREDLQLEAKLKAERPAILWLLIRALRQLKASDLTPIPVPGAMRVRVG